MVQTGSATKPKDRKYFSHVEGLRGLAALYVVLFHVRENSLRRPSVLSNFEHVTSFLQFGHFSVAIFIVISGFCLGLPVARNSGLLNKKLFAYRRFRRLYPAYGIALLLSLPLSLIFVLHGKASASQFWISLVTHMLLVHNLSFSTAFAFNVPMWSIGVESQIYVIFALILIPIWRKWGIWAQLTVGLCIGLIPHVFFKGALDWTCPWFVGLFAMGVWAAKRTSDSVENDVRWKVFGAVAVLIAFFSVAQSAGRSPDMWRALIVPDFAVGIAAALFLTTSADSEGQLSIIGRVVGAKPFEMLGKFSYSLYLIHAVLIDALFEALTKTRFGPTVWAFAWIAVVPMAILAAYALFVVAERPFMSNFLRESVDYSRHAGIAQNREREAEA